MTKDEALRLALEALEDTVNGCICRNCINQVETITAIKAALEAKDEPVGFMHAGQVLEMQQGRLPCGYVYPKRAPGASVALYRTPPQRKPLTDEEIAKACGWKASEEYKPKPLPHELQIARAIEAAHQIYEDKK